MVCAAAGAGGGGGAEEEGGLGSGMVDMIMRQLLSKEVLYTPLKVSSLLRLHSGPPLVPRFVDLQAVWQVNSRETLP